MDTTFGINGNVITTLPSSTIASSIALQDDGKIIVAGHTWTGNYNEFMLIRYNSNGDIDQTFGNFGVVTTAFLAKNGVGKSVAIQNDGKIVLAGFAYSDVNDYDDFAVVRYHSDGTTDTAFGNGGIVFTTFGVTQDHVHSVKIQTNGKIIVGGYSDDAMALARYLDNGSPDNDFGSNGLITTHITPGSQAVINELALTDDYIYACGFSIDSTGNSTVVRYDYDGNLSSGFGLNGVVMNNTNQQDIYKGIQVKENKIVLGGTAIIDGISTFTLSQMDLDGNMIVSFGTNGIFTAAPSNSFNQLEAIVIQNDGKMLVVGSCQNFPYDIGIIRVVSDVVLTIGSIHRDDDILIYPNPAKDNVFIKMKLDGGVEQVQLSDANGKVMVEVKETMTEIIDQKDWRIDLINYPVGVYLLTIKTENSTRTYKILKE